MALTLIIAAGFFTVLTALIVYAYKIGHLTEATPSISWGIFMVAPFAALVMPFAQDQTALQHQAIGVALIAAAMLSGDYISLKKRATLTASTVPNNKAARAQEQTPRTFLYLAGALAITAIIAAIAHMWRIGFENIPLLSRIIHHNVDPHELQNMRAHFSREAYLTLFEKYFYNFNAQLLAAPAITFFLAVRRYAIAALLFAFFVFYLLASMAKMPLMIFLIVLSLLIIHTSFKTHRNNIIAGFAILSLFILIGGGLIRAQLPHFFLNDAKTFAEKGCDTYQSEAPRFCTKDPSVADLYRLPSMDNTDRPFAARVYDYALYRMVITPSDVSYRWYQFYQDAAKRPSWASIIPQWRAADYVAPAHQVMSDAYTSRFPDKYTGYAYGSIDAEAYARGGITSIAIIAVILCLIRITPAIFNSPSPFTDIYRLVLIALLVILPPSASLHAMLIAHGLLPACGIIGALWLTDHLKINPMKNAKKAI